MKRTKRRLREYWDKMIANVIPSHPKFKAAENEIKEHFGFVGWMFKRIIIPLMIFYIVTGLILNMHVFCSLFVSLLVFVYSNFLPDIDFLIKATKNKNRDSLWYEKYFLLFFAPVIMYYIIGGRARPLYSTEARCFHNLRTAIIYGVFLFFIGSIFWTESLKRVMFPIFGVLGFVFHLMIDRRIKIGFVRDKNLERTNKK